MEDKFQKLIGFIEKKFGNDVDIEPLRNLMEEEFDLTEVCCMN